MSKHKDIEKNKRRNKKKATHKTNRRNNYDRIHIFLPENFSLLDNYTSIIDFINSIEDRVNSKTTILCLDMSNVNFIDVSALIYTHIILKLLRKSHRKIKLEAYYPNNLDIKKYLENCGFANSKNEDFFNFKIIEGKDVEQQTIVDIISYLDNKNVKIPLTARKALYSMLLELMDNTKQHAYDDSEISNNWYFYLEVEGKKVKFVFLDTGLGITTTIRYQNFLWSINNNQKFKLSEEFSDSVILKMALSGSFPLSSTRQKNRNKGLPNIHQKMLDGDIINLKIISRKACFNFNENFDLIDEIKGTLFYWEVNTI